MSEILNLDKDTDKEFIMNNPDLVLDLNTIHKIELEEVDLKHLEKTDKNLEIEKPKFNKHNNIDTNSLYEMRTNIFEYLRNTTAPMTEKDLLDKMDNIYKKWNELDNLDNLLLYMCYYYKKKRRITKEIVEGYKIYEKYK